MKRLNDPRIATRRRSRGASDGEVSFAYIAPPARPGRLRGGKSAGAAKPGPASSGTCAACGAETPPFARFCPQCGSSIRPDAAQAGSAAVERRQLTVVFCDLVGSSALASRLDPEDFAGLIGGFHRCVSQTMSRYGGFFARPMGDGALVFFGFPQAHEDDAERAVRASLATIEAVGSIEGEGGRRLHLKIGIATGVAIVGDVADAGSGRGLDAAGEAPNLAARLQELAEPDTVVVADNVRRLIGHLFVYRELGWRTLKGWSAPVEVAEVLRPAANPNRFEARSSHRLSPLIGRDAELDRLNAAWRAAQGGAGQVLLVSGEPGIGKSRLTAQLLAGTEFDTHARLRWFCFAHQQGAALHPCIQQIEHVAGFTRDDPPELRRAKLDSVLRGAPEDERILLADLMMVPFDRRSPVVQSSLKRRRERTLEALLNWLVRSCQANPVLAILEDAHWADPSTAEMLALVIARAAALPLLLVVTARPEFQPDWLDAARVEHIALSPLSPAEGAELIRGMAGRHALAEDVVQAIVARSDGVPLFLEEVTKAVLEADAPGAGAGSNGGPASVPPSIHASLLARLDRLGPGRRIAEAASAIGRNFSVDLLAQLHDSNDASLHDAIRRLADAGLILPNGPPGSGRFRFKHTLIQDTAYGMMVRERRRQLHGRIADALETRFPQTAAVEPQALAHHCTQAGRTEKAIGWWLRAGTQSLSRAAVTETISQLRRGLELNASLPDSRARRRRELDLQLVLAKAIVASQGHGAPCYRAICNRMRVLCAALPAPPQLLNVMFFNWTGALLRGELDSARGQSNELLAIARRRHDPLWECLAHYAAGFTQLLLGSFRGARLALLRSLELFDPDRREQYGTAADPRVLLHTYLAWERMCVGRFDEAWVACERALAEARGLRHPLSLAHALTKKAHLHLHVGAPGAALAIAEELQALTDEHGIALYQALATCFRGWCHSRLGAPGEGLPLVQRSVAMYRGTGTRLHLPLALRVEAELLGRTGDTAGGLAKIREALAVISETGERLEAAELLRTEGVLLGQAGELVAAETALREAEAVATAQGARLFSLRARTSLAELLATQGRQAEARPALAAMAKQFGPAINVPDVLRARQILRPQPEAG